MNVQKLTNEQRFQIEIEFIQCLCNPRYLNFLAQQGYFKDAEFLNYLEYLKYWKSSKYSKYLLYPQCLFFIDQLQNQEFRSRLANLDYAEYIHKQQFQLWKSTRQ